MHSHRFTRPLASRQHHRARMAPMLVGLTGLLVSACSTTPEPASQPALASEFSCGQLDIRVGLDPERGLLGIDYRDKRILLKPVGSDTSGRYQAPGDNSTRFQHRQGRAELTIRGETYPECLPPGALERPFTASGSAPVWRARVADSELVLTLPYEDQEPLRLPSTLATADRHGREFIAQAEGIRATLTVATQLCQDPVSGAQYPSQVRLTLNGDSYQGCGGDPLRLFRGAEWRVERLQAQGIIDRSRVTLQFLDQRRLAGQASCNRFTGRYQLLEDGGIDISDLALTRMACASSLMAQEDHFVSALERATRIRIGKGGELLLSTADKELLSAVQSAQDTP